MYMSQKKLRNDVRGTMESRELMEGEWRNRQVWKLRIGMRGQSWICCWNNNVSGVYPEMEILHVHHY